MLGITVTANQKSLPTEKWFIFPSFFSAFLDLWFLCDSHCNHRLQN